MCEFGRLNVNEFLQVDGQEKIFAIGDCANTGDAHLAYTAELHAKHVFSNIIRSMHNQALVKYKPGITNSY